MLQVARNLIDAEAGVLRSKRYVLLDRDTKYAANSRHLVNDSGTNVIRLPPLSPNLNAYAERFVRSIKDECLDRMIIVGQASLRRAVAEYMDHYHVERNHQGSVTDSSTETSLLLRMMVRFTGAGGLVECSPSTTAKRRDAVARVFGQNGLTRVRDKGAPDL